jgi:hypothetical protein
MQRSKMRLIQVVCSHSDDELSNEWILIKPSIEAFDLTKPTAGILNDGNTQSFMP